MGTYQIDFVFDWDADEQQGNVVRVFTDPGLNDHNGKRMRGSCLVQEELGVGGWEYFLGDGVAEELQTGRYRWKGSIVYFQDHYGEWDAEIDGDLQPANRKTRRLCNTNRLQPVV